MNNIKEIMASQLKILLVEDDLEIGNWTKNKIKQLENVSSFNWAMNIAGAQGVIKSEVPDIIILDLKLPDGNGISVLKNVKEQKLPSKVFVFSINTGMKSVCLRSGADAFFDKSSESDKLIDQLTKILKV